MKAYTISELARMAGVSVRALHHYDRIGLLVPAGRSAAGYRLYTEPELLRLQQILFFRELDMPLDEIRRTLDDPGFEPVAALERHRRLLRQRMERLASLLDTIDRTIGKLTEDETMLTDEELYKGFSVEQRERYRREARERWGEDKVADSERRAKKMSREQWEAVGAEGEAVTAGLAALMDRDPGDPEVQALIARHHAWVETFYPCPAEMYRGLAQLYVEHPEFKAFYEKRREGLAQFMHQAMHEYAARVLDKAEE